MVPPPCPLPESPAMNRIDLVRPDAPALAGYGPHPVGFADWQAVNPGQVDLVATGAGAVQHADRILPCAIWYPAAPTTAPGITYTTLLRDGRQTATLSGRACRSAAPAPGRFPLVILSHGYPGNRFLMSHLGETLASRGFVVVAADHPGSTYEDKAAFGITLLHRPADQLFLIDAMAKGPLAASTDTDRCAIIGYSMGGYGALVAAGAGLSDIGLTWPGGARPDLIAHLGEGMLSAPDPRLKAIVPIGPWGAQHGFWTDQALAALRVPMLVIGGSADEISGYERGIAHVFHAATGADRWLLTYQNAGHNAAAPIPAPQESWVPVDWLDFPPFEHYADPIWDSTRMNNIAQHTVYAFLSQNLQGQDHRDALTAFDSRHALLQPPGFSATGALGLRLQSAPAM